MSNYFDHLLYVIFVHIETCKLMFAGGSRSPMNYDHVSRTVGRIDATAMGDKIGFHVFLRRLLRRAWQHLAISVPMLQTWRR